MIVTNETNSRTQSNFSILSLIKEIQSITTASIDKNEFNRLIHNIDDINSKLILIHAGKLKLAK